MKTVKINLHSFINNWPTVDPDETEVPGELKVLTTFELSGITDNETVGSLQKKIAVHLFGLLVKNNENRWDLASDDDEVSKGRCMYCFKTDVVLGSNSEEPDAVPDLIQCSECDRLYPYSSRFDSIPLPHTDYIYIMKNGKGITYTNDYSIDSPVSFLGDSFDYKSMPVDFFNDLQNRFFEDGFPQVIDSRNNPLNISENNIFDVIYYPDFQLMMNSIDVSPVIKKRFLEMFWNVRTDDYSQKLVNAAIEDSPEPNFIQEINEMNNLAQSVNLSTNVITEFNKLGSSEFKNTTKGISRIIIKSHQDSTVQFINLLRIFHLFEVTPETPYLSLFIDRLSEKKSKVFRGLSQDLINNWTETGGKTKQLLFKVKIRGSYFTMLLSNTNVIKVILPMTFKLNIKKELLEEISSEANKVIAKISKLSYREKINKGLIIHGMSEEIDEWGTPDSTTEFAPMSISIAFQAKDIDLIQMASIIRCLKPYTILTKEDPNNILFLYIYDVDKKQSIRYDRFLWAIIKSSLRRKKTIDYDDIKTQFGIEFDLEANQLDALFQQWTFQNQEILEKLSSNETLVNNFNPISDGVAIKITQAGDFFTVAIQGIKYFRQDTEILEFLKKLFYLQQNIKKNKFFLENCKDIITKSISQKKGTNLKIGLKRFLPDIFWESPNKKEEGFTRKCQKNWQPLIFSDESEYLEWMKKQMPKDLTETQKLFTRNCPSLTMEELAKKLTDLNVQVPKRRIDRCLDLQKTLFEREDYSDKDLKDILIALGLPLQIGIPKKKTAIQRYLNIQTFLNREGVDNVYPNPQTFVIKRNDKKFFLTCPNGLDNDESKDAKYMGFVDINMNPNAKEAEGDDKRKFCVPCCKKSINEARVDFCSAVSDYDELTSGKASSVEYIKNDKKFPLDNNRYGHLPNPIHNLLNINESGTIMDKKVRLGLIKPMYLRRGIPQSNFSFLQAIISVLPGDFTLPGVLKLLATNIQNNKTFRSLNNGNLFWEFNGSKTQYANIMNPTNIEKIDLFHMWELISMPGLFPITQKTKILAGGINIIIFEIKQKTIGTKTVDELHVVCPRDQEIDHFYNKALPTIMLYRNGDQYEPIEFYESISSQIGIFNFNTEEDIFASLRGWYLDACSVLELNTKMTAKSLIKRFGPMSRGGTIKKQLIDRFNKVRYLITKDDFIIPTIPSGLSLLVTAENLNTGNLPLRSYLETYEFLKQNKFKPLKIIVSENTITHIILSDDRFVPVVPSPVPEDNKLPVESGLQDYKLIDEAILSDLPPDLFKDLQQGDYTKESYELFRYHFANFLTDESREQLRNKMGNPEDLMNQFVHGLAIIPEVTLENYSKPNIRILCHSSNKESVHCGYINGAHALAVLESDLEVFKKRVLNELDRFKLKRLEIIENTIDPIIDTLRFIDNKDHIFI